MNKSPKLLIVLGIFSLILIFGFIWASLSSKSQYKENVSSIQSNKTFDVASGDTNNEVLKSIIAKQKAQDKKTQVIETQNRALI